MGGTLSQLWVEIAADADDDVEHLARVTYDLRDELLDLDVDAVQFDVNGEAPEGSRGVDLIAASRLIFEFVGHEVLQSIVHGVRAWLTRQHGRSIKLTLDGDLLELTGVTSAEQDRLTELWVSRHVRGD